MTRHIPHYKLGHSIPEWVGDSIWGMDREFAHGAFRCDVNSLISADDVMMNLHYEKFLRHGYEHRSGKKVDTSLGVSHFTAHELVTQFWTTKGHHPVGTIESRVKHVLHHHPRKGLEIELKTHHAQHIIQRLWDETDGHPNLMIVKTLFGRPGTPVEDNLPAHIVGYPTLLSLHRPAHVAASAQKYTKWYRGDKPIWIAA